MTYYGLHGSLTASGGNGPLLAQYLLEAAAMLREAPGCRLYYIGLEPGLPDTVWISEVWDSKAAHDASLQDERVRALIRRAMPLLAGPPAPGRQLDILGGAGLPDPGTAMPA
ncbi:MAG: antibiotic biosynthesis monooxygenase [Bacteroidia bacterium]|nr:antibiotic biosynthesis monooxygenase [Bacteroidia bacterium]